MKAIMLVLTEGCNLACRYCYETCDNHRMTFADAKAVIDRELRDNPEERFKIFFFGGEPFVNFEVLKQVYDYVETDWPGRVKKYAVTTNGTLVHGELQQWLLARKDSFDITLSLDGTQQMHDRNRLSKAGKGTFELIDLKFFAETWPNCIAKMTISPDTLQDFAKGIIFIEQQGFHCKANFASGVDFQLDVNKKVILDNFMELVDYYSTNSHPLCYMLDLKLEHILVPLDEKFRYCGAGLQRRCYGDSAEEWYPCQGLMPMSVDGRKNTFQFEDFTNSSILKDSPCRDCSFVRICRTCYAMNYSATKDVYRPDPQICTLNRMCMLVSARIQYNRMQKQHLDNPGVQKAIWMIARELNDIFT